MTNILSKKKTTTTDIEVSVDSYVSALNNKADIDLNNLIVSILQLSHPIGSIYIQYKNCLPPADLYGGEWTNISNEFSNLFFRVEGNNTAIFGSDQEQNLPDIQGSFLIDPLVTNFIGVHTHKKEHFTILLLMLMTLVYFLQHTTKQAFLHKLRQVAILKLLTITRFIQI